MNEFGCSKSPHIRCRCARVQAIKASELTKENLPTRMSNGCPICSRGITFSYKDVLFLSQFMTPDGKMLNRRVSGVCKRQQRVLQNKINVARRLGIIPNYTKIKDEIGLDS
ncbi:large ribosomal subunit protein mL66-like isoform X2 [Rhopilema esculentum]|uniref:large ribosomal subunit protein mL66-like isoform X2 n=1 Tax=Rhopilema esculentum TaxID=499914 RepID=UPI0031D0C15D